MMNGVNSETGVDGFDVRVQSTKQKEKTTAHLRNTTSRPE